MTVVADRIVRIFVMRGVIRAALLDLSKAIDRVWHAYCLYKLKFFGVSDLVLNLVSSFLKKVTSNRHNYDTFV